MDTDDDDDDDDGDDDESKMDLQAYKEALFGSFRDGDSDSHMTDTSYENHFLQGTEAALKEGYGPCDWPGCAVNEELTRNFERAYAEMSRLFAELKAEKDSQPHGRIAEKDSQPHGRLAEKDSQPHERTSEEDSQPHELNPQKNGEGNQFDTQMEDASSRDSQDTHVAKLKEARVEVIPGTGKNAEQEEAGTESKAKECHEYNRRIPLSEKEMHQIQSDMYGGRQEELLVDRFNIPITRKDMRSLAPATWLNDEVSSFSKNCFFSCMIFVLLCR
jgi:hypothetical protein